MNRNPEYQFISTDTNTITSELVAIYESIVGQTVMPASPEMLFLMVIANIYIQMSSKTNYTGNQNIPSRAEGENLNALAELVYQQTRPGEQPAVSTERFYISATQETSILIPAFTKVTDTSSTLVWETQEDTYVPIGSISADVRIQCQMPGKIGNGYAIGQINTLIDIDNIAFYDRCENITVSDKGADVPNDDDYYKLMRASQDAFSTAGPVGAYQYHAKKVSSEIEDVVANSPMPGEVDIYVLMNDGTIAGEEIKNAVYEACSQDDVRPLTDYVVVSDPETVSYDIDFTYYIPNGLNVSSANIEASVQAAVNDYITWQHSKLGRDINPDELRQRVKETGIKRIVLNSPAFTSIRDGKDISEPVPQVAVVGNVNITNGGYENE